ncbi:MAG: four helix bundle protein [Waterburya sp.]
MDKNKIIHDQTYNFAIKIVKTYKYLIEEKKEFVLSKQLLKSGTSIGAKIYETKGAISSDEFSTKISLAYRETLETKYWLSLLKDTGYIDQKSFDSIYRDADEIAKILFLSLKSAEISSKA